MKIAVIGADGRMGRRIIALAGDCEIVGRITRNSDSLGGPDVVVDFSAPEATRRWLGVCVEQKIPLLIGTTGLGPADQRLIDDAARFIPIMQATNTSIGVAVLNQLVAQAAELLGDCAIKIVETHHVHKKDAPSGTALSLKESIGREVPIKSIRRGEEIGTHQVSFELPNEQVELTHRALDRDAFAHGALRAAKWLAKQKPGRYSIADALRS